MNVEEIKELMTLFNDSNMTEFHLSNEEFEVQFSKREEYPQVVSNAVAPVANVASPVEVAPVKCRSFCRSSRTSTSCNRCKIHYKPNRWGGLLTIFTRCRSILYKWVNKSLQTTLYVLSKQ